MKPSTATDGEMLNYPVMRGNAVMALGAGYFEVPMVSHVIENLFQGCSPSEFAEGPALIAMDGFTHILNLYPWGPYPVRDGVLKLDVEMFDSPELIELGELDALADIVSEWMDEPDSKVLVHCQAGLNRSSLVVARVLMNRYGLRAGEAVVHVRRRSDQCLCNPHFERFFLNLT